MTTISRWAPALITLTAVFSQPSACRRRPLAGPCASASFREFDFWAGEWDVHDAGGKLAGRNKVSIEERGCVVVERWRAANGSTGQSSQLLRSRRQALEAALGRTRIADRNGGRAAGRGDGPRRSDAIPRQNRTTLLRGTWTRLPDGRLRQQFVESDDGGKTWKPWFDGYYTPVRAKG